MTHWWQTFNDLDASWELDVLGKKHSNVESAEATEQAAQEDLRAVLVSFMKG